VIESLTFLLRQHLQKTELARNRPPRPRVIEVEGLLRSATAAANLPAGTTVEVQAPARAEAILDPEQITRVLTNLLINAPGTAGARVLLVVPDGAPTAEAS
jgi:hypothetical protein